jgi:hypothetical protein
VKHAFTRAARRQHARALQFGRRRICRSIVRGGAYRLERDGFEAKGFIADLERLLLTVDDNLNGKLHAQARNARLAP